MGDDMSEEIGRREDGIEMCGIYVTGHGGEKIDVVAANDAHEGSALADREVIEGAVPE